MWSYMMACYLMSLLSFILFVTAFFQSFLKFPVLQAGHLTMMVLTSIVYFFTETLVIFFFVGSGMGIKEAVIDRQLDPEFRKRSIAIKRKVFPPLLLNMLFMMVLFILVGAVDTRRFPVWAYILIFLGCLLHFVKSKGIQHRNIRETTDLMLEMSKVKEG